MAIKLTAMDFTARTGITEGSIVRWKTSPPDTDHTAMVTILHDTGIELRWIDNKLVDYSLERAFHGFTLVSAQSYGWKTLTTLAPMDTPEAARSFVIGMLAYQAACDQRPTPHSVVQLALRIETRKDAENLFRDLYNFSHGHIRLE